MTQQANFDRIWEYRFYDRLGLITQDRYPEGVNGPLDGREQAWRAADLFKAEHGITVTRIEFKTKAGT